MQQLQVMLAGSIPNGFAGGLDANSRCRAHSGMNINPIEQEHHYLPRFYQRRWAGADGKLVVFERPGVVVQAKRRVPKATGKQAGLYTVPGAPEAERNQLEERFWRTIDQWGADALAVIEATDAAAVPVLDRERWAVFLLALIFRDPPSIKRINRLAREHYEAPSSNFARRYDEFRAPHEPATFDEFITSLDQPGLSELGAKILRSFATNKDIVRQLLVMDWQVVTVSNPRVPLLTSDRPLIRHNGLKAEDGLLMLPLGPAKFFVAYNPGPTDMQAQIHHSIVHGRFMEAMNEYVVQSAVRFVYGADTTQLDTVEQYLRLQGEPNIIRW